MSVPDPASTYWVPLASPPGGGASLTYEGDYAGATTYDDGDVVVKDGIAFICVGGPTTVAPDIAPWGGAVANRPAGDLDYVERTTTLTVTATTAAGANEFIAANPITLDGLTRIRIEFFAPITEASQYVQTSLWDGSTDLGILTDTSMGGTTIDVAAMAVRYLTPAAGTHTFKIKAFRGTGSAAIYAGPGGVANDYAPACLRISRVEPYFIAPAGPTVPTYGLALPGSPADGQEHVLVDSLTAPNFSWRFRYNAGSSYAQKWEFVGGAPLQALNAGLTMTQGTAAAWTSLLPPLTIPRAGIYQATAEMTAVNTAWAAACGFHGRFIGSSSGAKSDITLRQSVAINQGDRAAFSETVVLSAGESFQSQMWLSIAQAHNVYDVSVRVIPVRVA